MSGLTRAQYVEAKLELELHNEGAATLNNAAARDEIMAHGGEPGERIEYEGMLPRGPFENVEVHEPPAANRRVQVAVFDVRAGVGFSLFDFRREGLIPEGSPMSIEPNGPPGGMITLEVSRPGERYVYEFNAETYMLRSVAIQRGGLSSSAP